jgi:hypothetical protein
LKRPRFIGVFAVVLALAGNGLVPATARAESPAELKKARAQFQRGIELEQAGNWSEAIQQFREVGSIRMTPQVRFHIAYCEEMLGRLVTALGGYELALAEADKVGPDFKTEVDTAITRLRERIPKLVIERGAGAEAASVQLDGVDLGGNSVGVEIPMDPGPHTVAATAPGYTPFSATAELKEREVTRVTLELQPEPVPPPDAGSTGENKVIVVTQADSSNRLVPYIVGGAGVAFLITGGVLLGLRETTAADLEEKCPKPDACPESNRDTYERLQFYSWASPVAFGLGAVGVGTAVVMIMTEKKPKAAPAAGLTLVPSAPGSLAGASLAGRF